MFRRIGTFGEGVVKVCQKNEFEYITFETEKDLILKVGESDSKIFFAIKHLRTLFADKFKKFLVYSLDTDVKFLSLYFSRSSFKNKYNLLYLP